MRFIIFTVFFCGWCAMWVLTYTRHIKTCETRIPGLAPFDAIQVDSVSYPLSFRWSSPVPYVSLQFPDWKDSMTRTTHLDEVFLVTGIAYRDEDYAGGTARLAALRTQSVISVLSSSIAEEKFLSAYEIGTISSDIRKRFFQAFRIETKKRTEHIRECASWTLLYFPYDSVKNVINSSIDTYLNVMIAAASNTGGKIRIAPVEELTADTKDIGLRRMQILQTLLTNRSIPSNNISIISAPAECYRKQIPDNPADWIAVELIK